MITIYTDGSARGNPGPGGWAGKEFRACLWPPLLPNDACAPDSATPDPEEKSFEK